MRSHRQILRSSAIIGSASAVNVLLSITKMKVLAVLLGPGGVGLLGIYQNVVSAASTVAGCGVSNSAVRHLAAVSTQPSHVDTVRRTLYFTSVVLGLVGMALIWAFSVPLAEVVFRDQTRSLDIELLSLAVLLTVLSASQVALLQGLRRLENLARVNILGAAGGCVAAVGLVLLLAEDGVLWSVLVAPAITFGVGWLYTRRLSTIASQSWEGIRGQALSLVKQGFPLMLAATLGLLTQLGARTILVHTIGLEASGHFQAAWAISMTYIGFVLAAMGADFYPRLTASIDNPPLARVLVNEQIEMGLLMAGPVLLAMVTMAPWATQLLYSSAFIPAAPVLRWQVMGDLFKVLSWPMAFILLAQGRGFIYVTTEAIWSATYLSALAFSVNLHGLLAAGWSFCAAYAIYAAIVLAVTARVLRFRLSARNAAHAAALALSALLVIIEAQAYDRNTPIFGLFAMTAAIAYSLFRLNKVLDFSTWLQRVLRR